MTSNYPKQDGVGGDTPQPQEYLTVNSGDMLGDFQLKVALEQSVPKTTETVLVAPNKRIQKQWRKEYPGIKVVLQSEYKGYPLPTELTHFLGVQPKKGKL